MSLIKRIAQILAVSLICIMFMSSALQTRTELNLTFKFDNITPTTSTDIPGEIYFTILGKNNDSGRHYSEEGWGDIVNKDNKSIEEMDEGPRWDGILYNEEQAFTGDYQQNKTFVKNLSRKGFARITESTIIDGNPHNSSHSFKSYFILNPENRRKNAYKSSMYPDRIGLGLFLVLIPTDGYKIESVNIEDDALILSEFGSGSYSNRQNTCSVDGCKLSYKFNQLTGTKKGLFATTFTNNLDTEIDIDDISNKILDRTYQTPEYLSAVNITPSSIFKSEDCFGWGCVYTRHTTNLWTAILDFISPNATIITPTTNTIHAENAVIIGFSDAYMEGDMWLFDVDVANGNLTNYVDIRAKPETNLNATITFSEIGLSVYSSLDIYVPSPSCNSTALAREFVNRTSPTKNISTNCDTFTENIKLTDLSSEDKDGNPFWDNTIDHPLIQHSNSSPVPIGTHGDVEGFTIDAPGDITLTSLMGNSPSSSYCISGVNMFSMNAAYEMDWAYAKEHDLISSKNIISTSHPLYLNDSITIPNIPTNNSDVTVKILATNPNFWIANSDSTKGSIILNTPTVDKNVNFPGSTTDYPVQHVQYSCAYVNHTITVNATAMQHHMITHIDMQRNVDITMRHNGEAIPYTASELYGTTNATLRFTITNDDVTSSGFGPGARINFKAYPTITFTIENGAFDFDENTAERAPGEVFISESAPSTKTDYIPENGRYDIVIPPIRDGSTSTVNVLLDHKLGKIGFNGQPSNPITIGPSFQSTHNHIIQSLDVFNLNNEPDVINIRIPFILSKQANGQFLLELEDVVSDVTLFLTFNNNTVTVNTNPPINALNHMFPSISPPVLHIVDETNTDYTNRTFTKNNGETLTLFFNPPTENIASTYYLHNIINVEEQLPRQFVTTNITEANLQARNFQYYTNLQSTINYDTVFTYEFKPFSEAVINVTPTHSTGFIIHDGSSLSIESSTPIYYDLSQQFHAIKPNTIRITPLTDDPTTKRVGYRGSFDEGRLHIVAPKGKKIDFVTHDYNGTTITLNRTLARIVTSNDHTDLTKYKAETVTFSTEHNATINVMFKPISQIRSFTPLF